MADETTDDKLVGYIKDAIALEENVERQLGTMIDIADEEPLRQRLQQHQEETRAQADRLRSVLQTQYGETESAMKDLAGKAGAAVKGMVDATRSDTLSKSIRDAYVTEHTEIAAYELLMRTARSVGDEATANVAAQNLQEEQEMARFLESCWDVAAQRSLQEVAA